MSEAKRLSTRNSGHEEDWNSFYEDADGPVVYYDDYAALKDSHGELVRALEQCTRALELSTEHAQVRLAIYSAHTTLAKAKELGYE